MATIKPTFNERLYEFCVNAELVTHLGALIAGYLPEIPSPKDEFREGWDAKFTLPLYGQTFLLQYKIARRTTARAGANAKFWDVYHADYYRFSLHRDTTGSYTQHSTLLGASQGEAAYCAPVFHERADLAAAARSGSVLAKSALISVADLGAISPGMTHSVTYPVNEAYGTPTLHSEPRRLERVRWRDLAARRATPDRLDETHFYSLVESLRIPHRRRRERADSTFKTDNPVAIAYLTATEAALDETGATLVVVPEPQ